MITTTRRRAGFTILEIMIVVVLLGTVLALTVGSLQNASGPITSTSYRADMAIRGATTLNEAIGELEGSAGGTQAAGSWASGAFAPTATSAGPFGATIHSAFRFQRATYQNGVGLLFDTTTDQPVLDNPTVLTFVPDGTFKNGWNKCRLVRVLDTATGEEVTICKDVFGPLGADSSPAVGAWTNPEGKVVPAPNAPGFAFTSIGSVTVRFTMLRRVDADSFARMDFEKNVNLRNNNLGEDD